MSSSFTTDDGTLKIPRHETSILYSTPLKFVGREPKFVYTPTPHARGILALSVNCNTFHLELKDSKKKKKNCCELRRTIIF